MQIHWVWSTEIHFFGQTPIFLWENNRVKPSLRLIPKIIEFLGYDPYEAVAENLADNIKAYRRLRGLSQKKLAELLGVDQTTLAGWERGEHRQTKRLMAKVSSLI